jgi:hypothetical protein
MPALAVSVGVALRVTLTRVSLLEYKAVAVSEGVIFSSLLGFIEGSKGAGRWRRAVGIAVAYGDIWRIYTVGG